MLKHIFQQPTWRKIIVALIICTPIVSSEQILPQLVAQLASLDHDHGISLVASDDGVDLVLTHDHHSFPENDEAQALALSVSEPAHVVHILTGAPTAKQSASLMVSKARDLVPYFSTAIVREWWTFVPPLPFAYSRPPPDELSILPLHRSTLLLI